MKFLSFIWHDPKNKRYLLGTVAISTCLFATLKIFYPYPDFFSDSSYYIYSAANNLDVSIWPIGYSKFLAIVHLFTTSATFTVAVQYLLLQAATLYLFFTMLFLFEPSAKFGKAVYLFLIPNLLILYVSNTISSDALFTALSIGWFTEILWILRRPTWARVVSQAFLLFLCFTVRNNAYYYPLISILAFLLASRPTLYRLAGISLPALLIVPFIIHTREAAYRMTGTKEFSFFTGWQLANNALYVYPSIHVNPADLITPTSRELNRIYTVAFGQIPPQDLQHHLDYYVGNFFIREPASPLKQYFAHNYRYNNEFEYICNWGKASAEYERFGISIISSHPIAYIKHFVIPNAWHYLVPPLSHLQEYNYGTSSIDPTAQHWFNFQRPTVTCASYRFQGILILYTTLFFLLNLLYLYRWLTTLRKIWIAAQPLRSLHDHLLPLFFLSLNFAFSIASTQNILRYQVFPMIVLFVWSGLLHLYPVNISVPSRSTMDKSKEISTIPNPAI